MNDAVKLLVFLLDKNASFPSKLLRDATLDKECLEEESDESELAALLKRDIARAKGPAEIEIVSKKGNTERHCITLTIDDEEGESEPQQSDIEPQSEAKGKSESESGLNTDPSPPTSITPREEAASTPKGIDRDPQAKKPTSTTELQEANKSSASIIITDNRKCDKNTSTDDLCVYLEMSAMERVTGEGGKPLSREEFDYHADYTGKALEETMRKVVEIDHWRGGIDSRVARLEAESVMRNNEYYVHQKLICEKLENMCKQEMMAPRGPPIDAVSQRMPRDSRWDPEPMGNRDDAIAQALRKEISKGSELESRLTLETVSQRNPAVTAYESIWDVTESQKTPRATFGGVNATHSDTRPNRPRTSTREVEVVRSNGASGTNKDLTDAGHMPKGRGETQKEGLRRNQGVVFFTPRPAANDRHDSRNKQPQKQVVDYEKGDRNRGIPATQREEPGSGQPRRNPHENRSGQARQTTCKETKGRNEMPRDAVSSKAAPRRKEGDDRRSGAQGSSTSTRDTTDNQSPQSNTFDVSGMSTSWYDGDSEDEETTHTIDNGGAEMVDRTNTPAKQHGTMRRSGANGGAEMVERNKTPTKQQRTPRQNGANGGAEMVDRNNSQPKQQRTPRQNSAKKKHNKQQQNGGKWSGGARPRDNYDGEYRKRDSPSNGHQGKKEGGSPNYAKVAAENNERWDIAGNNKKRKRERSGNKPMIVLKGAQSATRKELYVQSLDYSQCNCHSDLEDTVFRHCKARGIILIDACTIPKGRSRVEANCKITVKESDCDKLLDPDFWPEETTVRYWDAKPRNGKNGANGGDESY